MLLDRLDSRIGMVNESLRMIQSNLSILMNESKRFSVLFDLIELRVNLTLAYRMKRRSEILGGGGGGVGTIL